MKELAIYFRAAQLYAHIAHNIAKGSTFFQDHEFLGELYGAYELAYDEVVERMIGAGLDPDLVKINIAAANELKGYAHGNSTEDCFKELLDMEKVICEDIKSLVGSSSTGTQNLLQGLADDSEKRQFLIGQRLK